MTCFYAIRGTAKPYNNSSMFGEEARKITIASAKNLYEQGGFNTYVVGIDHDTKEEHLVWHWAMGEVPHEHRHVRPENLAEGL